ncbi:MAG: sensor histidine kinase [Acidimicrobiales bacterium]
MVSDDAGRDAASDQRQRRQARWLVVVGFVIWAAGLGLWTASWIAGLGAAVAGGAALTIGLERLARGSNDAGPSVWGGSLPVAVSLVLISQGVGQSDYGARVALVGVGTLGLMLVLLRIVDERIAVEHRLAQRNLADERRRLAGDVHDVVGHTLSASMLHTTAARLSVRSDPDAAIASLERAERHGRRSMDDIRSVVRLLRDDDGDGRMPAPLSGDIPEMVEEFRAAGAEIDCAVSSELGDLPATTALTAYRVVQEGLTNAVRHGTGTIDLAVDSPGTGDHVEIRIGNDVARAAASTGGSGLAGMRERVTAVGGTLEVGADGSHRWVLCARIPR